jgi:hypothetical protein
VFTVLIICCSQMKAQSVARDSKATKTTVQTEKVRGFWEVMGYVGGKLTRELSSRLNIESKEKDTVPTEVKVELGWIKFTRIEDRPEKE